MTTKFHRSALRNESPISHQGCERWGFRRFELVAALQFGAHDPQVVHVLAAHGAKASDDTPSGTLALGKPSARTRAHDGLSHLGSGIVVTLRDVAHQAAFADGFINGSASPPAKAAQPPTIDQRTSRTLVQRPASSEAAIISTVIGRNTPAI